MDAKDSIPHFKHTKLANMILTETLILAAWLASATAAGYVRGLRGSRGIPGEPDVLCCDLGRTMGHRAIRVIGDGSILDRGMMSRMATCGERRRRSEYTFSKRQRKMEDFCLREDNEEIAVRAPRALRWWLARQSIRLGSCECPDDAVELQFVKSRELDGEVDNEPSILDIDWEATTILGEDVLDEERALNLRIEESDQGYKMFGNSGCNNVFGPLRAFSEVDRSFEAGSVASTRKYCRGYMSRERKYIKLLKQGTLYYEMSSNGDTLSLFDSPEHDDPPLAEFERVLS